MARTIGTLAVAGGNTAEIMGCDQSKAADLAKALGGSATAGEFGAVPAGDIVIVALLAAGVVPVVAHYGDALAGKVIVETPHLNARPSATCCAPTRASPSRR
jgi:predicted dinucleotide-binding enzyme